jgi:hypothetical protein
VSGSAKRGLRARWLVGMLTVVVIGLCSGCGNGGTGPGAAPAQALLNTYVGRVDGSPALIAVITDGDRIAGFFTDGKSDAKWFATAKLDNDEAKLVARDGTPLGQVKVSEQSATGQVTVGLGSHNFDATHASGEAGLFTAAEKTGKDSFEAGWVVLPDGSTLGTYDTFINGVFQTHPAPKLRPTVKIPQFGPQVPHQQTSLFLDANIQAPS